MDKKKISANRRIDAALHLDGDPERVRSFYDDWARHYDLDTASAEYSGPPIAARLLQNHLPDKDGKLLDAGCGTGLVGVELQALGYTRIDGFDLSPVMTAQAAATGAYGNLRGEVDMMRAATYYPAESFDAVLSIGVFTLGHVPPEALPELLQLVRGGGLLLVSTRTHYYDETDFQQVVDDLLERGSVELVQLLRDAPYNNDGDGHYWVLRRIG